MVSRGVSATAAQGALKTGCRIVAPTRGTGMRVEQLPAVVKRRIPEAKPPLEYDIACQALVACTRIDEAKYWSDKADALAAWAKIYRSDTAATEARRLRLHAYRRMGELAGELRPAKRKGLPGSAPGPVSLLVGNGLKKSEANAARKVALLSQETFREMAARPKPPSPFTAAAAKQRGTQCWTTFSSSAGAAMHFRSFTRQHGASELARGMTADEASRAREIAREITEWLDEFEQHLPK